MRTLVALAVLLLTACASGPVVPKIVRVPVVQYRALPEWATAPLAVPAQADTVRQHLSREHALDSLLRRANCHRALLAKLDRGEDVKDCGM